MSEPNHYCTIDYRSEPECGRRLTMQNHTTVDDAQAAQITGLSRTALARLRRDNQGPETIQSPFTGEMRYQIASLHKWLEAQEVSQ